MQSLCLDLRNLAALNFMKRKLLNATADKRQLERSTTSHGSTPLLFITPAHFIGVMFIIPMELQLALPQSICYKYRNIVLWAYYLFPAHKYPTLPIKTTLSAY